MCSDQVSISTYYNWHVVLYGSELHLVNEVKGHEGHSDVFVSLPCRVYQI